MPENMWECPKCNKRMSQPSCVKQMSHRCREKSSEVVEMKLVEAPPSSGDVTVIVSGASWRAACNPAPASWPSPTERKVGRGVQYILEGDGVLAAEVESHLRMVGDLLLEGDAVARETGRVLIYDADRIASR